MKERTRESFYSFSLSLSEIGKTKKLTPFLLHPPLPNNGTNTTTTTKNNKTKQNKKTAASS